MSFRDFTLPKVQSELGVQARMSQRLFPKVAPVPISVELAGFWTKVLSLGMAWNTEKGRSELLTAPLLAEVWDRSEKQIALLSGVEWTADAAAGLNGYSDFLLCRSQLVLYVTAPVLVAVEAKKDNIAEGLGQCAATMVGAQRFNAQEQTAVDPVYGCVTTGANWRFLRLSGTQLDIDVDEYSIAQPERILGVLLHCCGVKVS